MDDTARPQSDIGKTESETAKYQSVRQDDDTDTINLADYLRVISKHRIMIFLICAIAVIMTAIVSLFLPKRFSATASILPPMELLQDQSKLGSNLGLGKGGLAAELFGGSNVTDMYVGILKSRVIADAIIDKFNLMKLYRKKYHSEAIGELRENTTIKGSEGGIVSITVLDRDPERAAAMANAYVEELDRQNKRLSTGQTTSKRVFLENRLREIQTDLSNIENMPSREAKIKEMLFELLTREYEVAKIEEAKSMPTIQVLDKAVVPEKRSRPKRKQMVLLAGTTALFVSVFAAFVREYLARTPLDGV
jgi:uncharacterized protein involved in exopolysaccharide biosynthesis